MQIDAVAKFDYHRWLTSMSMLPAARGCQAERAHAFMDLRLLLFIRVFMWLQSFTRQSDTVIRVSGMGCLCTPSLVG